MLRGRGLNPVCEIMLTVSPISWSVGLCLLLTGVRGLAYSLYGFPSLDVRDLSSALSVLVKKGFRVHRYSQMQIDGRPPIGP